jgi:hypothetical protein
VVSLNQACIDGVRAAGATTQNIFVEGTVIENYAAVDCIPNVSIVIHRCMDLGYHLRQQ